MPFKHKKSGQENSCSLFSYSPYAERQKSKTINHKGTKEHEGKLKDIGLFYRKKIKDFDLLRVTSCPSCLKLFRFKTL